MRGDSAPPGETVIAHWNARSLPPKEELLKEYMDAMGISICMLCETNTYKQQLSDKEWVWQAGPENAPGPEHIIPPRGLGVLAKRSCNVSLVHASENIMAVRTQLQRENRPLFVIECHFEQSNHMSAHVKMWDTIQGLVEDYEKHGHVVVLGDMNAHTKANGDRGEDAAGRLLTKRARDMGMVVVNQMGVCPDQFTRVAERSDGTQTCTTIDYAMVSGSLAGRVKGLHFGERLGSDHKVIMLHLRDAKLDQTAKENLREVWRIENIPSPTGRKHQEYVNAFQVAMERWMAMSKDQMAALESVQVEANRVSDIMEWSFQVKLDQVCMDMIGTKKVGPRPTPMLDSAMRMLNDHRSCCESALKRAMTSRSSTSGDREKAVQLYRNAKAELFKATRRRKEIAELEVFRQVEEKQANSKLFWARAKRLRGHMKSKMTPPPMVAKVTGEVEADPVEVLKVWRRFSAEIAKSMPEEEGIYDDAHRIEVEQRLEMLRKLRLYQHELDGPITVREIFDAIRKLKMGKAPGMDGILTSVIKSAADAAGTSELKKGNTFVEAISLLFNYVFDREVWPERWGSGIVFPLYKQDSRLQPGNYRPITLLSAMGKLFGSVVENRLSTWSEKTGAIADEQGGFRRGRGTIDQLYLLKEIISSRKSQGLPTLVTYIDARKAYDTVWREGNYVRLFDVGVQGKLWRQIQAMGQRVKSKVRLPIGETDWYEHHRGVAQGAVESPWLYSNFINGMADELRAGGFGILIGGIRIPLLMYADDIVLLADNVTELHAMNRIASRFAFKNRFRHNGDKSAVMVFNADSKLRQRVKEQLWVLSGERVEVKNKYKYLGVDMVNNTMDWTIHVKRVAAKAKARSQDLLWMCRRDKGLRPRSAATLWKATVRPILEYAAELWAGEVPRSIVDGLEKIQTDFGRGVLGLKGQFAVPNVFIRAELGLEILESRREKLRLGFWWKLQSAPLTRALAVVAAARRSDVLASYQQGGTSWMWGTRRLLTARGLQYYWQRPSRCASMPKEEWKERVYRKVERHFEASRKKQMQVLPSMQRYSKVKDWGRVDTDKAVFKGEEDKLGSLVPERYLDDTRERLGCKLKLMCRAGCLPTLQRIVWEKKLQVQWAGCMMCASGVVESQKHVLLQCSAYDGLRAQMKAKVNGAFDTGVDVYNMVRDDELLMQLLMGRSVSCRLVEDVIDHAVKRFLKKAWRKRKKLRP